MYKQMIADWMNSGNTIFAKVPKWFEWVELRKCFWENLSMEHLSLEIFEYVMYLFIKAKIKYLYPVYTINLWRHWSTAIKNDMRATKINH